MISFSSEDVSIRLLRRWNAYLAIGENAYRFVIHGRSKERSDAAQTRGSIP